MKGDASKFQNQTNQDRQQGNQQIEALRGGSQTRNFNDEFMRSLGQGQGQQTDLMNQYKGFGNAVQNFNLNPADRARVEGTFGGYQNFANTGGFDPQGIADIRARSIAPTRAVFQRGMDEVARNRSLSGSNTGSNAALAKMSRDSGQAVSDANVNANAGIAQMVQQGKLAGLGGMSNVGQGLMNSQLNADQMRNQFQLAGMGGQRDVMGTTPGMASMLGNMFQNSRGQDIDIEGLQRALSSGLLGAQLGGTGIKSNFQQAMGNIGSGLGLAGKVGGFLGGLF